MPEFAWRALTQEGSIRSGVVAAASREAALAELRRRRISPFEIAPVAVGRGRLRGRTPQARDLMLFTRELAILLHAGAPVDHALAKLDRLIAKGPLAGEAGRLLASIRGGAALSDAVAARPEAFPPFYAGMLRAGEAGGSVPEVLDRIGAMFERADALQATLRSALAYPLLVLILTGFSLVILLTLVIPEFRPLLEQTGAAPPLAARIVLGASDFAANYGGATLVACGVALLLSMRWGRTATGRARIDAALFGAPLVGDLVRKVEAARYCRALGTLRANGVPLVEGARIAAGVMRNAAAAKAADRIAGPLSRGEGLSRPMRVSGVFPELALELVEVGEESGRLDVMLLQVADVLDAEAARAVQRLLAILAPAVTIALGAIVAFVIAAILSAILSSYDIAL